MPMAQCQAVLIATALETREQAKKLLKTTVHVI